MKSSIAEFGQSSYMQIILIYDSSDIPFCFFLCRGLTLVILLGLRKIAARREGRITHLNATEDDVVINELSEREKIALIDLAGVTYNQIDNYIENNVTDLASAKTVLKKIAKIISLLIKRSHLI